MPPADRRSAALVKLVLAKVDIATRDPKCSAGKILVAIDPLYAIQWASSALSLVGPEKVRQLLARLRNSTLGRQSYEPIHAHLTKSLILPNIVTPREWGLWSDLINRYNLFGNASTPQWAELLIKLQVSRIWNPTDLSSLCREEAHALGGAAMAGGNYIILWQATKCFCEYKGARPIPLRAGLVNKDIDQLLTKFQENKLEDTKIYREYTQARGALGLPRDFEDLSPANRTSALAKAVSEGHCCRHFVACAARLNILRTAQGSLRSVTSGIRSYVRFAAVLGRIPFPPSEATIQARSCIFKPGRTYQNYLPRVKKACFLLELHHVLEYSGGQCHRSRPGKLPGP